MVQVINQKFLAQDQSANPGRSLTLAAKLLTQSWSLDLPVAPGTVGQSLRAVIPGGSDQVQLEWYTPDVFGTSSVGSNLVFAGPNTPGYPANPGFRSLQVADLPSLPAGQITTGVFDIARLPVGTTSDTVAAGDDTRFHDQNTDTGTTSSTFRLDSAGTGLLIKATASGFELRNSTDTDYANLRIANTIAGETVTIEDNQVLLNSNVTGAPTEDGGISLNRGTSAAALLNWSESSTEWQAGVAGDLVAITRRKFFTVTQAQADTVGGYAITHNLGTYVSPVFYLNGTILYPTVSVAPNIMTVDFGGIQFSGVITVRIDG